ncbi:RagB/SusD family nutrient uptake outer membrane protein [Catalinimonas niigatensis]|uniref:RagB/SusD family nutrient uptake outer membrane protein n=1 Tax=Catalinimonas niigatensis TaxID=1397264 RepID=UPI002665F655|nr:RagB/SusD family nutrient uptake outer membrane protein [Catalinimonas niigatensis]WPP50351.1 RagB/SusD family nutrient uptake outer membrane protein [Catalinimonas niigatensis]
MRKKYIYIPFFMGFLVLFSCSEDFLDKSDPTVLVASTFYQNATQVEQAVNGVYGQLQPVISNQWQYNEFITDNTTLHFNQGNRGQGPSLEALEFWQINSSTGNIANLYNSIYGNMVNINTTLARLENATIDTDLKNRFEGELKFVRAYYYFHLVQYFGDVIIITEPLQSPSDAYAYAREPAENVYQLVIDDLNFAVDALPASYEGNNVGRATKGAALSLLGKVYLTRKDYGQAVSTLTQVLPLGYSLLPNYADVFDPQNKNHAESIFDIQFQGDNQLGEGSRFIYVFAPRESRGAVIDLPGQDGEGWNIPSLDMMAAYEEGDLRKAASLNEGYTNLEGEWVPVPYIIKYHHPHSIPQVTNDNWPVIRYADVLLMLAEAINEQSGPTEEAYGYLNQIRERADLDPISGLNKESFRTAVLQERRVELAFENHRWFDLKRTMTTDELVTFLNAYGAKEISNPTTSREGIPFSGGDFQFEAYEALFPIPADQLRINDQLRQNPGY